MKPHKEKPTEEEKLIESIENSTDESLLLQHRLVEPNSKHFKLLRDEILDRMSK